jgi:spermidine synthase
MSRFAAFTFFSRLVVMLDKTRLHISAVVLGAAALGVQVLLIRQMMTVFYGNELIIGVVMALWLLWVGLGSALGNRLWKRISPTFNHFSALLILALIAVVIGACLTRYVRVLMATPFGEYISFAQISFFCTLLLLAPCLLFGLLFSLLVFLDRLSALPGEPSARIYTYEAAGTAFFGLLLVPLIQLSNLTCFVLLPAMAALFLFIIVRKKWLFALFLLIVILLASGRVQLWETRLINCYWRSFGEGMNLLEHRNTRFGEVALLDWAGETWLYKNGGKISALPDEISNQQLAATIVCAHPQPRQILIIEGNAGGLPLAVLHFDSLFVTASELDRQAFEFVRRFDDSTTARQFQNPRLRVVFKDARRFLRQTQQQFDIVVINSGNPASAGANRYYTREFFHAAKQRLSAQGLLVITHLSAGENYMGDELLAFHKIMFNTLSREFRQVMILPGDEAIFLATDSVDLLTVNVDTLTNRYVRHNAHLPFFHPAMFNTIYDSLRVSDFRERLFKNQSKQINRDFRPISYIYDFLVWHKVVSGSQSWVNRLFTFPFSTLLSTTLCCMALFLFLRKISTSGNPDWTIPTVTFLVGFTLMAMNFILILAFQTLFGYIYSWISAAIATFMTGMAAASGFVNGKMSRWNTQRALRYGLLLLLMMLVLLLPMVSLIHRFYSTILYAVLMFIVGAVGGAVFPLLCGWHRERCGSSDLGGIYAADVIGGGAAAFVLSAFMIPVYGYELTLIFSGCAVVFALVLTFGSTGRLVNKKN